MPERIPLAQIGALLYTGVSTPALRTNAELEQLCSDTGYVGLLAKPGYQATAFHIIFLPYAFDLTHFWFGVTSENWGVYEVESSTDTTDGLDGTWLGTGLTPTKQNPLGGGSAEVLPSNNTGVRGIRWRQTGGTSSSWYTNHVSLYGTRSSPRGLHLIETGTTDPVTGADLANTSAKFGVARDYTFRIRNDEATGANGVTVASGSNSYDAWIGNTINVTFSDGGAFSDPLNVGDIDAGTQSTTITMRVEIPNGQPLGTYRPHVVLDVTSWD